MRSSRTRESEQNEGACSHAIVDDVAGEAINELDAVSEN